MAIDTDSSSSLCLLFSLCLPVILSSTVIGEEIDLFGTLWFYWWVDFLPESGQRRYFYVLLSIWEGFFAHTGNNLVNAYLSIPFQKYSVSKLSTILCVVSVSSQFNRPTTLVFLFNQRNWSLHLES